MPKSVPFVLVWLGLSAAGLGCSSPAPVGVDGGGDAGVSQGCSPGQTRACACAGAGSGTMSCQPDGGFGLCACGDGGATGCTPGQSAACTCDGGQAGESSCAADGSFGSCSCAGPDGGGFGGRVALVGGGDASGARVQFTGGGVTLDAIVDSDGGYFFPSVPAGSFTLTFHKNALMPADAGFPALSDGGSSAIAYQLTLPGLLFVPDGGAFASNGLVPFSSLGTVEIPAGQPLGPGAAPPFLVAPDGGAVVFLAELDGGAGTLYLATLPGGAATPLATGAFADWSSEARFSPDGHWLFYLTDWTGDAGTLDDVTVSGGSPAQLGTGVPALGSGLKISDDGSHAFFLTGVSGGLGTLNEVAEGGSAPVQLGTGVPMFDQHNDAIGGTDETLQLTRDGRFAIYVTASNGPKNLNEVPVAGGTPVQIGTDAYSFQPTADGAHVFYANGSGELVETSGSGSGTRVLGQSVYSAHAHSLELTSDGSHAFFLGGWSNATGSGALYEVAVDGGTPVGLGNGVPPLDEGGLALSPDNSHAVFITGFGSDSTLNLVAVGSQSPVQLGTGAGSYAFTADGTRLVYLVDDDFSCGALNVLAVSGGAPVQLATCVSGFEATPDGRFVFLADSSGTLSEVSMDGGAPARLGTGAPGAEVALTPDQSHAFFLSNKVSLGVGNISYVSYTLNEVPVAGGTPVQLDTSVASLANGYFALTPDGRYAFYLTALTTGPTTTGTLKAVAVGSGTPVQLGGGVRPLDFQPSPDSSHVVFLANWASSGTLESAPVGGAPVALGSNATGFTYSPDGRYLAFAFGDDSLSAIVPVAGSKVVPLNAFAGMGTFAAGGILIARGGTPAPFDFEDGLYFTPLP